MGFIIDLKERAFRVPNCRVENLKFLSDKVIEKKLCATARDIAKVTGSIISMSLVLGPVARLWTRALNRDSSSATTWDRKIILSIEGQKEIKFWAEEFDNCHGVPIWKDTNCSLCSQPSHPFIPIVIMLLYSICKLLFSLFTTF